MHCPFMQHLLEGDRADLAMDRDFLSGAGRKLSQVLDVGLTLVVEMIERLLGIGLAIQLEMHLRVVRFKLGTHFLHESIHAPAIAVAFGMGKMREDLANREAIRCRLPTDIIVRKSGHQSAENLGCCCQQVDTGKFALSHALHSTLLCGVNDSTTIHAGAWSLAFSSPRTHRSTPP